MIITVTMNPALDKTVELDRFEHAALNQLKNVVVDPGGKGINVSKTLASLGAESIATGFIAGSTGRNIEEMLEKQGIKTDFIHVNGETRMNLKVVEPHGILTELNEPGFMIDENATKQLLDKLENLAVPDTFFVLTGSGPMGISPTIYAEIMQRLRSKGVKVLLDATGELLIHGIEAKPDIVKINRYEMSQYILAVGNILEQEQKGNENCMLSKQKQQLCKDVKLSEQEIIECAKELCGRGIEMVVVTMDSDGALFIRQDKVVRAEGLYVDAHSAVGAGDAMAAALAYGITNKLSDEECIRLAMATSAGAVMTVGTKPPTWEQVKVLQQQVSIVVKESVSLRYYRGEQ